MPIWDADGEYFYLDFHGKAKQNSVKNMILVNAMNENEELLLFGKQSDNTYLMEFGFPLSARVALAIDTTSFDFKWASE